MAPTPKRRSHAWVTWIVILGALLVVVCGAAHAAYPGQREQHRTAVLQAVTDSQQTLPGLPNVQVIQDIPARAFGKGRNEWEEPRCYYGDYAMVLGSTEDAATVIQQATPVLEATGWHVDEPFPNSGKLWSRTFIRGDQERLTLSAINDSWIASFAYEIDLAMQKQRYPTIMSIDLQVIHPQRVSC